MDEREYPPPLPTAYPTPPADTGKSGWPTAIGVISVVLASLGLICTPLAFVDWAAITGEPTVEDLLPRWYQDYGTATTVVGIGMAALLLIGGIQLLRRRPSGRTIHLIYGGLGILVGLLNAGVTGFMLTTVDASAMEPGMWGGFIAGVVGGLVIGMAYPVFLVIWFARPKIIAHVLQWRERLDREAVTGPER